MQINVAQLLKEPMGSAKGLTFEDVVPMEYEKVKVSGKVSMLRLDCSILVTGVVEAILCLTCSRCLQEFHRILPLKFEEEFFPTIDILTGLTVENTVESNGFTISENHVIDLEEVILQYLILNLPMKPLCQTDCPGLCLVCGANLKEVRCSCEKNEGDLRWRELKKLLLGNEKAQPAKKRIK